MFNTMKKLIRKKFYKTAEEAQEKIDVFFAVGRLTDGQYAELELLIREAYAARRCTASSMDRRCGL